MGKVWHDKCNSEVSCRTECRIQDEVLLGHVKGWAGKILSEPPPRREGTSELPQRVKRVT